MLYAEWSGKTATIYNERRKMIHRFTLDHDVVGVQVSGDDPRYAQVAIAMSNGRTRLCQTNGKVLRF